MRAVLACVLVLIVASLAAGVTPGRACSCALPEPRAALAQADGAFVGTLVSRRQFEQHAELTFSVDRALKGPIGKTVEVLTASNSAACGLEAPIGTRIGLVLDRRDGAWHGHLCWQFEPAELIGAALPLPPPDSRGPVALVVGAALGDARLLALDARGRTVAYGRGGGRVILVSTCPGGLRLAELATNASGTGTTLVIRHVSTLRIVRRETLRLPSFQYAQRLVCNDRVGSRIVLFAKGGRDSASRAALYDVKGSRLRRLWAGQAHDAALTPSAAYLSAGRRGQELVRVDLQHRSVRRLARLDGAISPLTVDATTKFVAGVRARLGGPSDIVLVDLRRGRTNTMRVPGRDVQGQLFWLPGDRLLFLPAWNGSKALVLDTSLQTRSRFRWNAAAGAVVGRHVFGIDSTVSLRRADLPSGPARVVRRLPGRPTLIVSTTR